ncbi:MAG: hypothetical protein WBI82_00365 [Sphaerochaeta sp.]|jgi:hypothetical protein
MKSGRELHSHTRWIRLARLILWDEYEMEYAATFPSNLDASAKPFRMALGALILKEMKKFPDEELVEDIRENPLLPVSALS